MKCLRNVALAAGLTIWGGSIAVAADLPLQKAGPARVAAPYNWTGFYTGFNAGYAWATSTTNFTGNVTGASSVDSKGVFGGIQAGYNWQTGAMVFGSEADFQFSGQKGSSTGTVGGPIPTNVRSPWFMTARARVGFTPTPTWLIYGTGGLLLAKIDADVTTLGGVVTDHRTRKGWTAGGGVEVALSQSWTAKLEYLYLKPESVSTTNFGVTGNTRSSGNLVRVGANYHF
jgi:outer membrane immunogenic protein